MTTAPAKPWICWHTIGGIGYGHYLAKRDEAGRLEVLAYNGPVLVSPDLLCEGSRLDVQRADELAGLLATA